VKGWQRPNNLENPVAYLKRLGIALLVVTVLVIGGAFLLPSTTTVERSVTIQAPACNIHVLLDGYGWWNDFSPWAGIDPDAVYSYEGPVVGVGARMIWQSEHPNVGSGNMEITAVEPCASLTHALDFGQQGKALATWTLEPVDGGVDVTWNLVSEHGMNPANRYFGLMLDSWVGGDYEKGLAALKGLAEGLPTTDIGALELEETTVEPKTIVAMESRSANDGEAMGLALGAAYGQIQAFMQGAELQPSGAPVAVTKSRDEDSWLFQAGIPISGPAPKDTVEGPVQFGTTPGGEVVKVTHTGPYAQLPQTYAAIDAWFILNKRERGGATWEAYVSDPATTAEDKLVTKIFVAL
jgi:effector-binding domain-containing protein